MVEGIEGVGEAVPGGMVARAVEPGAGETLSPTHEACLNCGTLLIGDFCHFCGQTGHVHRSLSAFWHDLAHSVLHFEGKIWRTLPLLAWRPGELTSRYIAGERARFVSPMALFLFSVFLMFAIFSAVGGPFAVGDTEALRNTRFEMAQALESERKELKDLQQEREERIKGEPGEPLDLMDERIREKQQAIKALETIPRIGTAQEDVRSGWKTGWPALDQGVNKLNENPSLALYKIQNNAYKFSWMLIPLSVPLVWLLFPFSRRAAMYDHTVFVTYSLSFMTLLMVVLSFLRVAGVSDGWIGTALFLLPPIHMYRQLRGAYRLSRWSAVWRTFLLVIFAFIAGSLFFTLLLALGALG